MLYTVVLLLKSIVIMFVRQHNGITHISIICRPSCEDIRIYILLKRTGDEVQDMYLSITLRCVKNGLSSCMRHESIFVADYMWKNGGCKVHSPLLRCSDCSISKKKISKTSRNIILETQEDGEDSERD